jgi:hypothetical protein
LIKADDIAQLARVLVTETANEARIRCAVSRAYYAAFHYCDFAATSWCNPLPAADKKDKGEHAQLYLQLQTCCKDASLEKDLKLMVVEAKKLRDLRIQSDYELTDTVDQKVFGRSIHLMGQVKSYLDSLVVSTTKN